MLSQFAFATLESAINQLLKLDPDAQQALRAMHPKVVEIQLQNTGITLYFIPDAQGEVQILQHYEGEADCSLIGSPFDLMRANDQREGTRLLFAGEVEIVGDRDLAQAFSQLFSNLDLDWEEQLAKWIGDISAHQIGESVRAGKRRLDDSQQRLEQNLSEYLSEELQLLPHRFQVEDFIHDIDLLREDVDRLIARVDHLNS